MSFPSYGYQTSSPVIVNGNDGLWLTSDSTTGVGLRAPVLTNSYSISLPSQLPLNPNSTYLGISSITGSEATTNWLPASGKIPWSVAVPGSVYENIAEYIDVQTAFTNASSQTEPVTVLILPGVHDIQPNVILPVHVNLQGWGINTSILNGELQVAGPYSSTSTNPFWWFLGDLSLQNTSNVALRITNNGTPISGNGIIYTDRVQFTGGNSVSNDDGGTVVLNDCIVDSSQTCITSENGGVVNLFHSKFVPFSGGNPIVASNSVVLLWNSQVFDGPPTNTAITLNSCFFRAMSSLFNIEQVNMFDTDTQITESHADQFTTFNFRSSNPFRLGQILNSQLYSLDVDSNTSVFIEGSEIISLVSGNGFNVESDNSIFQQIEMYGTPGGTTNRAFFNLSTVRDHTFLFGQVDTATFDTCSLKGNTAVLSDLGANLYITNSTLEHLAVSNLSSTAEINVQCISNQFKGDSVLLELNTLPNPIFVLNSFNINPTSGTNIASGTSVVQSSNNIASPGAVWNVSTVDAGWTWL